MSVKVEKTENKNEVKLEITIEAKVFDAGIKTVFNKNAKYFNIPGFRKGKAPMNIVEKYYGSEIFYEDAFNEIVPAIYDEAVKEQKLEVVSKPEIDIVQIGKGKDLIFTAVVSTKPEVKLGKYKGIALEKTEYKVTDAAKKTVAFTGISKSSLKKVSIPKEVIYGGVKFKVTAIADKALKGKSKVTSVTIGANVTSIGKNAFDGCSKLKSITVPSKVKSLGKEAFKNCKNLKTITIKSTVLKTVGKNALKGINSKAKIKVPSKKLSSYKKLFKGKGQAATVKISK